MEDVDELLWRSAGDVSAVDLLDWRRIHDHVFGKLPNLFGTRVVLARGEPTIDAGGFFSAFKTVPDADSPLELRLWGTFGVDFPGRSYTCVQGFVYAYHEGRRIVTLTGENHIYIRYARIDAGNDDWDMAAFSGPSEWRTYGWSVDEFGEFEGYERWADNRP